MEKEESKNNDNQPQQRRPTVDLLNKHLEKGKFETKEERNLIQATLEGKNRDIVAIVKDEQLRRIWLSYFYKRANMTKASIDKINLNEVMQKISSIQSQISMQHMATLLAGLGEVLKKKYNLTENDVKSLLEAIINPIDKSSEEQKNDGSPNRVQARRARGANAGGDAQPIRPINAFKMIDFSMLLLPKGSYSSTITGKSSVTSKSVGQLLSEDGQMVQRDQQLLSDMASGDNFANFNQHDIPGSGINEIAMNMFKEESGSRENGFGQIFPADSDFQNIGDVAEIDMIPHSGSDAINHRNSSEEGMIKTEGVDLDTPEFDLDDLNNMNAQNEESKDKALKIKNRRRLNDLLIVDKDLTLNTTDAINKLLSLDSEEKDNDESIANIYHKHKADHSKMLSYLIKTEPNMNAYDNAFYSTDDESGNEGVFAERLLKQCKALSIKTKKQLHIIKEESEHIYQDNMDSGFDNFDMAHSGFNDPAGFGKYSTC